MMVPGHFENSKTFLRWIFDDLNFRVVFSYFKLLIGGMISFPLKMN